jgi:hypothetical protein
MHDCARRSFGGFASVRDWGLDGPSIVGVSLSLQQENLPPRDTQMTRHHYTSPNLLHSINFGTLYYILGEEQGYLNISYDSKFDKDYYMDLEAYV